QGLEDRTSLHERFVIQGQAHVFRSWPKAPPLSKLTLRARRRGGAETLIDSGVLRLSISGRSPGQELSREQGTLNAAGKEQGVLGSALIYAALQNYGGEVRPTRAKALAVPLTPEASAAGSPLNFPHD